MISELACGCEDESDAEELNAEGSLEERLEDKLLPSMLDDTIEELESTRFELEAGTDEGDETTIEDAKELDKTFELEALFATPSSTTLWIELNSWAELESTRELDASVLAMEDTKL
jgi:hypothetical protein